MKKKMVGIFVVMLVISSALTTILFSDDGTVEASEDVNLDYDYVWDEVQYFANVIHDVNWSENGENGIPKGRSWATGGENYTIDEILEPNMNGTDKPCGLTRYMELPIGYLSDFPERKYSNKIVIENYNLTVQNGDDTIYFPYTELFPFGVGCVPLDENEDDYLNQNFSFKNTKVEVKDCTKWDYIADHYNVSCDLLNAYDTTVGPVQYLDTTDSAPREQDCVFILKEEFASEAKLNNLSDAMGCILIENETKTYTFENASQYYFPITKLNGTDSNFSSVMEEIQNDSIYLVDNLQDNTTLVFSNYSNESCFSDLDWVAFINLSKEDDFGTPIFTANIIKWSLYPHCCECLGVIMANYVNDTHYMCHTVRDWKWFTAPYNIGCFGFYSNRYALPIFSINGSFTNYFINNKDNITVDGFIEQTYRKQNSITPGVISHNVVAYRNIPYSPDDAIVVLSNRMDSWWGECPGDASTSGAILLGIAKYMKDNNITPKYNLTFLFTTGEEYGMRGAQHYVDSHPTNEYNFKYWIGFEQLGFHYPLDAEHNLSLSTYNSDLVSILSAIQNQTNYEERMDNQYFKYKNFTKEGFKGAEDYVWKDYCDTILIEKADNWDGHHQTGNNFQEGDSLQYINRMDVNVTFELAWNMTKYFTINPNCWFDNISFVAFDTPNDGDTLNDSIRTNFTIHSVLPSDKVKVVLDFRFEVGGEGWTVPNAGNADYTLTSRSQNASYVFTMPDFFTNGNFSVSFDLYNSTGRINRIVHGSSDYNDTTGFSNWLHLYHPLGYPNVGRSIQSVSDKIFGSVFTANENGRADNITAFINRNLSSPGPYTCMLYQASDEALIGTTTSDWTPLPQGGNISSSSGWAVFNFTGTKPLLEQGTQYIITCWGDSEYSRVYYNDSGANGTGRYDDQTYGTAPPNPADFTNNSRYYSIYCSYTPDIIPPQITDVTASPHTIGFGYNVTITVNVTDNGSDVNLVKVRIADPGKRQSNNTMTHISGNQYQYVFTDTWDVGQYNYSIWAQDNETNSNTSDTYHFHVSANATISIATLQNSYTGNQYINITDPPNPPENYTLIDRGLTWDTYYDATTGQNVLEVSAGPINYQEENTWMPINMTISQLTENHPAYVYGYRSGNNRGLYGAYFKSNAQLDWPVAFTYNKSNDPTIYAVRSKLVGVGYVDPQSNWAYQYLQNVQNSQGQINDHSITYPGVFTGTNVTWSYGNTGLKEEITLSNTTMTVLQNHPPSEYGLNDTSSYLVFITKLDHQNLNLYNNSGMLNVNVTMSDAGIDLKDALGHFKCALPLGEAYELNNETARQKLTYRIIYLNGNTYLLSGLKIADLNVMTFPVVVDPTLTVYSSSNDGYIYTNNANYNTVRNATSGTVAGSASTLYLGQRKFGSTYFIYRGFVMFNTTALPSNAYIDNATISLYKNSDYSTTDFLITIQNGQPTYPHNPLQSTDYNRNYYSGDGGSFNTSGYGSGYNNINLNMNGISWLNKTGWTKLCLRSNRDINGNAPTGNEFIITYANEYGSGYQPKLVINYRNQSKIKNTGSTNIKGYLLIQVQFLDTRSGLWIFDNDTINETTTRTITSGNQLALDTIFNGHVRALDLTHGTGTYRVYAAFRDPEGNILRTNDDVDLEAWWQFSKT